MSGVSVVFFDIGQTLAVASLSAGPLELAPLPGVVAVLRRLQERGIRLGVISNTGTETAQTMRVALQDAGLYDFLEPQLLIYSSQVHLEKNSVEIFLLACERASSNPAQCLFVGEDADERGFATSAGLSVADCPAKALQMLAG